MMTTRCIGLRKFFAALLVSLSSTTLSAQGGMLGGMGGDGLYDSDHRFKIILGGGLTVTGGGQIKSQNQNGFHFTGSVLTRLPRTPLYVRPEFTYTTFRLRSVALPPSRTNGKNYTRILGLLGNLEYQIGGGVYALAGAGVSRFSNHLAQGADSLRSTGVLLNGGAGYRFEFGPIQGFFEMRVATTSIDEEKFGYSRARYMPFSFGFVF